MTKQNRMEVQLSLIARSPDKFSGRIWANGRGKRSRTKSRLRPRPCSPGTAWVGAERMRDIVNTYDPESYKLPLRSGKTISFRSNGKSEEGITSFTIKSRGWNVQIRSETFFTPVYERTEIRKGFMRNAVWSEEISADFTQSSIRVTLTDVKILDHGPVLPVNWSLP